MTISMTLMNLSRRLTAYKTFYHRMTAENRGLSLKASTARWEDPYARAGVAHAASPCRNSGWAKRGRQTLYHQVWGRERCGGLLTCFERDVPSVVVASGVRHDSSKCEVDEPEVDVDAIACAVQETVAEIVDQVAAETVRDAVEQLVSEVVDRAVLGATAEQSGVVVKYPNSNYLN